VARSAARRGSNQGRLEPQGRRGVREGAAVHFHAFGHEHRVAAQTARRVLKRAALGVFHGQQNGLVVIAEFVWRHFKGVSVTGQAREEKIAVSAQPAFSAGEGCAASLREE